LISGVQKLERSTLLEVEKVHEVSENNRRSENFHGNKWAVNPSILIEKASHLTKPYQYLALPFRAVGLHACHLSYILDNIQHKTNEHCIQALKSFQPKNNWQ